MSCGNEASQSGVRAGGNEVDGDIRVFSPQS
jgi:hypothetical protein